MDIMAAKLGAKMAIDELSKSGQIGSGTSKVYTYDGNTEGRVVVPLEEGVSFVKISDEIPDLHTFISFTEVARIAEQYEEIKVLPDEVEVVDVVAGDDSLFGAKGCIIMESSAPRIVSVTDISGSSLPSKGLYFVQMNAGDSEFHIAKIEFSDVKPSDPKYLVKTIDLDKYYVTWEGGVHTLGTVILALTFDGGGTATIDDAGTFWQDVNTKSPMHLLLDFLGSSVRMSGETIIRGSSGVEQVCFGAIVQTPGTLGAITFNIILSIGSGGKSMNVKSFVTPLGA